MPEEVVETPQDLSSVLGEVEIPETSTDTTENNTSEQVDSDVEPQVDSDENEVSEDEEQLSDNKVTDKKSAPKSKDILKTDYKDLSPKIKEALKANPELKASYFQAREYAKAFDTPEKAIEVSETLDLYGGIDAIKTDMAEFATTDTMFAAGDPGLIDKWAEMSPDGFAKIVPAALDKLYKVDPEMYSHVGSKMIASYLTQQNGLIQSMSQYYNTLDPKSSEAKLLSNIYSNYLEPIIEMSKKVPEKKVDPERLKLQEEKQSFENEKQQIFLNDTATETNKVWSNRLDSELNRYTKGKNISKEQTEMLKSNIDARFKKLLDKDASAQQQMVSILRSGDKAKYIKYMQSKLEKYMPSATDYVWKAFNGVNTIATKEAKKEVKSSSTSNTNSPILVNNIPKPSQIDREATEKWAKTQNMTYNQAINKNTVVLKNGKLIKW